MCMREGRDAPKPAEEYRFLRGLAEAAPIQKKSPFGLRVSILGGRFGAFSPFVRLPAEFEGVSEDLEASAGVAEGDLEKRKGSRLSWAALIISKLGKLFQVMDLTYVMIYEEC